MYLERKELQKEKYQKLKQKLSQLTSLNGSMTVAKSPNRATELLESIFERNSSCPVSKGRRKYQQTHGQNLFKSIKQQTLSLVDRSGHEDDETEYSKVLSTQRNTVDFNKTPRVAHNMSFQSEKRGVARQFQADPDNLKDQKPEKK